MSVVLGIGGDGQLGAMMVPYIHRLGMTPVILGTDKNSSGGQVAKIVIGDYRDEEAVVRFGSNVDFMTIEFEDVNARGLSKLASLGIPVRPSPEILMRVRDKFVQKETIKNHTGIPMTAYAEVRSVEEIALFAAAHGYPVVLKQRFGSYDGYGNAVIHNYNEIAEPFAAMSAKSSLYVEANVPFHRELAQIITRAADGDVRFYPLVETRQTNGICDVVVGPYLSTIRSAEARTLAQLIAEALGYVGTLAVELFEVEDEPLLVNELASRVHNSGHWSIDGAWTSQFENHVRAVAGFPLGSTRMTCRQFAMQNILGRDEPEFDENGLPVGWDDAMRLDVKLHWYGKEWRKGRKLGHITATNNADVITEDNSCLRVVQDARELICC